MEDRERNTDGGTSGAGVTDVLRSDERQFHGSSVFRRRGRAGGGWRRATDGPLTAAEATTPARPVINAAFADGRAQLPN